MSLQRYREKRDFTVTGEPRGKRPSKAGFSYVIQKHAARNLHYDFRLELDGVLLSWAVPKGPSLDPKVRRLAMQVEDHPIEYGSFEGTIPEGEYGGGTVMVWDEGTWRPLDDPRQGYVKGHLRFELHGAKLRGVWHLVRTGKSDDVKKQWLLFKSNDADAKTNGALLEEQANSAQTGRSMEEIAEAKDNVWHSNRASKDGHAARRAPSRTAPVGAPRTVAQEKELRSLVQRGKRRPLPKVVETQSPTGAREAPSGSEWGHEVDYEGHRLLVRVEKGAAKLTSDRGGSWTKKFPRLAGSLAQWPATSAVLDGKIAVLRPDGTTDLGLLENAIRNKAEGDITFFVFDLLYLDGYDLRALPLRDRKSILERLLASNHDPRIRFSPHFASEGKAFFDAACKLHVPAIVSKKLDRPYSAGKSRDWLRIACTIERSEAPKAATLGVRLTHPQRVLYPREGITKQELVDYYAAIAPWMLPHVAERPLTLVRCPEGIEGQKFFQKHAKAPLPKGIRSVPIRDDGERAQYTALGDVTGLLSLAQMSVVEIHTWGAHADDPEKPDLLVFDLDPDPAVAWADVIDGAKLVRGALAQLHVESYVKTTGGKGLHVCAPIARRLSWDEAKDFSRGLSELIVAHSPKKYTATMSKAQRRGKIFIDFFRNGRGATFIAPYSTRARDGAPVATPLAWDELSPKVGPDHFNVRNVLQRMAKLRNDPWKDASSKKQVISAAAVRSISRHETR